MNNVIIVANVLAGVGVGFLLLGHERVSRERFSQGYKLAALGGFLVMLGSILLESWSVVFLNLIWIGLSLQGLRLLGKESEPGPSSTPLNRYLPNIMPVIFVIGLVLMVTRFHDLAAWACTAIYLVGYWLLTTKRLPNQEYMLWTFLGFFLLINHLIEHQSYAVLVNESIGALISLKALLFYLRQPTTAQHVKT